jgi:hypothetical protein
LVDVGNHIVCWFCPICKVLTLLENAVNGECADIPRQRDCPLNYIAGDAIEKVK